MKRQRKKILEELQMKRAKYQKIVDEEDEVKSDIKQLKYELNGLIGINRFPSEVMSLILKRLKVSDLFACERVCQRWHGFVREFGQAELIISELKERKPRKWKFSKKICSPKSIIISPDLHLFEILENSFLIELKRLKIINYKPKFDESSSKYDPIVTLLNDLDFVNKLENLQVLEVSSIQFKAEATLTLPQLRCLEVSLLGSKLKLATPELTNYRGESLELIEFVFKEKVTHLCLDNYESELKQLKNLQYLCLKNDCFLEDASIEGHCSDDRQRLNAKQFLNDHRNLKELSIRPDFYRLVQSTYNLAQSNALKILEQKKSLKREEFKLIFFGVHLENAKQLVAFEYPFRGSLVRLHFLNYSALCTRELQWVKRIDLSGLLRCVSDKLIEDIPPDFYEKFDQVEEIVIPYDFAEEQIAILKKFKHLNSLIVRDESRRRPKKDWNIFEKIADALPKIWSLQFDDLDIWELGTLDFVFKFKKLGRLLTHCNYTHYFVWKLFEHFDEFRVSFEENVTELMVIRRSTNSNLELWIRRNYFWNFHENCENVADLYEGLRRILGAD